MFLIIFCYFVYSISRYIRTGWMLTETLLSSVFITFNLTFSVRVTVYPYFATFYIIFFLCVYTLCTILNNELINQYGTCNSRRCHRRIESPSSTIWV